MVTIAMDLQDALAEGPPVVTTQVVLDDDLDPATAGESMFGIGGVIREAATNAVLTGATVTLDGIRSTVTDSAGRFRFPHAGAGNHALTATAPGFATGNKTITVPAAALNDYDLALSP
jgi:hypothetical protein